VSEMLSPEQLEELRQVDSPTIANAIETFAVQDAFDGYCGPEIECIFPEMEPVIGYAVTVTIESVPPGGDKNRARRLDFFQALEDSPKPAICVFKDVSENPRRASQWGEMMTTAVKSLGAVGVVTDGVIRDINEIREIGGLQYFAQGICVSHGSLRVVDVNVPVEISGCKIEPGDLLHGDLNGVLKIPHEIASRVIEGVRKVRESEGGTLKKMKPRMTAAELKEAFNY